MEEGYIKLYRSLLKWEWIDNPNNKTKLGKDIINIQSEYIKECEQYIEWLQDYKQLLEQQKIGEWCPQNDDYFDWYECSECGYGSEGEMQYSSEYDVRTNYCPNCGTKMEGV